MKICPSCREEFLDHIRICAPCDADLVEEEAVASLPKAEKTLSKEDLINGGAVALLEGPIDACREVELHLNRAKIPCLVFPLSAPSNAEGGVAGVYGFAAMKYAVLVQPDKVDTCKEVLQEHFRDQVAREGKGAFVAHAVDISAADAACPACGQVGGLEQGECSGCGLFLGGER